jgi:hypothetical protein
VLRRVVVSALVVCATRAFAQSGVAVEGGLDLILPTGARTIGMGQAVAATVTGAEALLWNPAGVARGPREVSGGFVTNVVFPSTDLNLAFVYPIPQVMTLAIGLRYLNTGEQPSVDANGQQVGTLFPTSTTLTTTFAAPFGNRFGLGVSFKILQVGFSCTGSCDLPSGTPRTFAFDVGGQYQFTKDSLVSLGVAVRNAGLPLQINDAPQADPLPGRADLGLAVRPRLTQYPGVRLTIASDVVTRLNGEGGPGYRLGGELSWLNQYFGRVGYVRYGTSGASGPTFGVGLARSRWRVDFAQFVSDIGGGSSSKPTYLTLRYVF